ncbi:hypothetical protein ABYF36_01155 [Buchananella sp. 22MD1512]
MVALVCGALALGGCSLRLEREPGALPPLTHLAELREELFGIERAIEAGATGMAQAAGASVPAPAETDAEGAAAAGTGGAGGTGTGTDGAGTGPGANEGGGSGSDSAGSAGSAGSANPAGPAAGQYPLTTPTETTSAGNVSGEALVGLVVRSRARQGALGGPWQPWTQGPAPAAASAPPARTIPANPIQLQELVEQALLTANELALLTEDAGQAATATTLTISYAQELTALSARTGRRSDSALLAAAPTSAKQHIAGLLTGGAEQVGAQDGTSSSAEPAAPGGRGEETAAELSIGSLLAINYVKWTADTAAIASEPEQRAQFTKIADRIGSWLLSAQPVAAPAGQGESQQSGAQADVSTFSVDRSASPRQWVESALAQAVPMLMQEAVASPAGDPRSPLRAVKRQAALMYAAQLAAMQVEWGAAPSALPGQ